MNNKLIYLARRAQGVSREDWPRTWKSHAVFASQFAVATSRIEWMRYCNRIDAPELDGKPVELPMLSTAHDGVANINNGANAPSLSPLPDDVREKLDNDELRVFDRLVRNFAFACTETAIVDGLPGKAAIYVFLPRLDTVSPSEFKARLDGANAALARDAASSMAGLKRYAHNHPISGPLPQFAFDAIVEIWFETPEDAVRALAEGALDPVIQDFAEFADRDAAEILLTAPCHAYPKDEVLLKQQQEIAG